MSDNKCDKDPKYLGIPNICFSLSKNDNEEREIKYKKQRLKRGFDDSETWSLSDTIANFIIPRFKVFTKISYKFIDYTKKEKKQHKQFLRAMKLIVRDDGARNFTEKERKQIKKGLKAFPKIFDGLWW
jgi:hypothetical protein